jgi:predicted transposase YbfD/YdcC
VQQVGVVERTRRLCDKVEQETVFYITSLSPEQASPARLLRLIRAHWQIENQVHYVRDVTAGEDQCRVRTRNAPEVLAALRHATHTVLRASGETNLAASLRHLAAVPKKAIDLVKRFVLRLL